MQPKPGTNLKSIAEEHRRRLTVRRVVVRPGGEKIAKIPPREVRKLD